MWKKRSIIRDLNVFSLWCRCLNPWVPIENWLFLSPKLEQLNNKLISVRALIISVNSRYYCCLFTAFIFSFWSLISFGKVLSMVLNHHRDKGSGPMSQSTLTDFEAHPCQVCEDSWRSHCQIVKSVRVLTFLPLTDPFPWVGICADLAWGETSL